MRRRYAVVLVLALVAAMAVVTGVVSGPRPSGEHAGSRVTAEPADEQAGGDEGEEADEEGDAEGLAWFYRQRAYPSGIPVGAYAKARSQASLVPVAEATGRGIDEPASLRATGVEAPSAVRSGGVGWVPLGPSPISAQQGSSGFRQYSGPPPYAGRITAIAAHPTNRGIAYVGGAVGGVWKTVDGGRSFRPVFDRQASLAIGSLAVNPLNPRVVYAGTGEASAIVPYGPWGPIDSYYGTGLYKSTDSGAHWARVGGSRFGSCKVAAVQPHPRAAGVVVAAVSGVGVEGRSSCAPGIYRSTDGGGTWSRRLNTAGEFPALSLAVSPAAASRWIAGVGFAGVYRSKDGGRSWARMTVGLPSATSIGRVVVAISPVDSSRMYAAISDRSGDALGVWTSGNGGSTWGPADSSGLPECRSSSGQCTYDLALAASPGAAGNFTVGGVRLRRYTSFGDASSIVLDPSTNGGQGVHWDIHALTFDADGRLWIGTDGGVYRWDDISLPAVNLNATLGLSQFYPGISGTTSGRLLGGAQDMATNITPGTRGWRNVAAGDGGYSVIDSSTNPDTLLATSQYLTLYRSTDGGGSFHPTATSGIPAAERRQFITPLVAGTGSPHRLYAGLTRVYRSGNAGGFWRSISPVLASSGTITAVAQAPSNANVVWAATSTGRIFRTLNALSSSPSWLSVNIDSDPVPYRFITDIAVDPGSAKVVWVTVSGFNRSGFKQRGHVFRSRDAGQTWVNVSGNLPNTPVNAAVIKASGSSRLVLVGSDVGVFATSNGGSTWRRYQSGLPNVVVSDLRLDNAARRLIAATYGRGMFTACTGAAPSGNAFGSPRHLTGSRGGSLGFTTTCASRQSGEPLHSPDGNRGGASVWLTWKAPRSGKVTMSTAGSSFDTVLAVYTGSTLGGLTRKARNDDASSTVRTSRLTFTATAGRTYRIAVDGYLYKGYALARNGHAKLAWSTS